MAISHLLLVTVEEHQRATGAGSAVNEFLAEQGLTVPVMNLGLPDHFIDHGKRETLLAEQGLDADGIRAAIEHRQTHIGGTHAPAMGS